MVLDRFCQNRRGGRGPERFTTSGASACASLAHAGEGEGSSSSGSDFDFFQGMGARGSSQEPAQPDVRGEACASALGRGAAAFGSDSDSDLSTRLDLDRSSASAVPAAAGAASEAEDDASESPPQASSSGGKFGPPSKRTREQHELLCGHMRERKARRAVSHARDHTSSTYPYLMDYVSQEFSRVTVVLQYYSLLLRGEGSRLQLLWRQSRCSSFEAWLRDFPGMANQLAGALTLAASLVHRRHQVLFSSWPWRLAQIADGRLSLARRQDTAQLACSQEKCCADPWFLRRILGHHTRDPSELLNEKWSTMLLAWARQVRCSTASIEFLHAQNRKRSHCQTSWSHFASLFVNSELRSLAAASKANAALAAGRLATIRV
jgi:hypothetical protein